MRIDLRAGDALGIQTVEKDGNTAMEADENGGPRRVDSRRPHSIDRRFLRRCLGQFATGVTVVSYEADGEPRGATVNSFTSVSIDPPLILISIANTAKAAAGLSSSAFAVNVLAAGQRDLALNFAGQPVEGLRISWVDNGSAPRLRGTAAWFECEPWTEVPAGDHVLFIGQVVAHDHRGVQPLIFKTGQFHELGAALEPALGQSPFTDAIHWMHHKGTAEGLANDGAPPIIP